MTRWILSPYRDICGACANRIAVNDPVFVIVGGDNRKTWRKVRCASCAWEPKPAQIDPGAQADVKGKPVFRLVERSEPQQARTLTSVGSIARRVVDAKLRQTGDEK